MPRELLTMTHPTAGTGRTTLEAFHAIWEAKDWVLETGTGPVVEMPRRNGSKRDWVAYAIAHDMDETEAEAKTRDDLAALFHPDAPPSDPPTNTDADPSADPDSEEEPS